MVQSPIVRHKVFQQPLSWSKAVLPPPDNWCRLLYRMMNGRITSPSLIITQNTMKLLSLIFNTISTSCGDKANQWLFCEFIIWSCEKNQSIFGRCAGLSFFKTFVMWSFLLSLIGCDNNWPRSHFVWEIVNVFMYYLPNKKLKYSHVPGY